MPTPPVFPDFKEIKLVHKELFDEFFQKYPQNISEMTFTNLFCWRHTKKYLFSVLDDHLIITFFENKKRKFLQPIGKNPETAIRKVLKQFPDRIFDRVEKGIADNLTNDFEVTHERDMDDYVYKISDLTLLQGTKYQSKRNFIKRCEEQYAPETCTLTENTLEGFYELQEKWCNLKHCNKDDSSHAEDLAIIEALKNFKKLGIFGFCVNINSNIAGFAIGEKLNENTYVEHFEKADSQYVGIYQYLLNGFVKSIPKEYTFLNREQDLGVEGLKKAKESYHPERLIEKFTIKNHLTQASIKP